MKQKTSPSPDELAVFARLKFVFFLFLSLAFVVWEAQDFVASFAATEVTTQTTLRTTQEPDDARVLRAFAQARQSLHLAATLETEPNPQQQTRDARLILTAKSKAEVLSQREQMVQAMQAAFQQDGGAELFDIGNAPSARPVQNGAYLAVQRSCQGGALLILLIGLIKLGRGWKHSGLPPGAFFGILAAAFSLVLVGLGREGMGVWMVLGVAGVPLGLLTLVWILTQRVHRAAHWTEGRARIVTSKIKAERHRHVGDTTQVRNLPQVEYEFNPGTGLIQGDRITLGFGTADNADVVVKRYPVGATVPVYYDPQDPENCVLERDPPASLGCIWGGAIFLVIAYEAVALSFWNIVSINDLLNAKITGVHHPLIVGVTGLLGLLSLSAGIWNMLHPRKALPWIKTPGRIVSSEVESFEETDSSSSQRTRTYYRPVIEYSYIVEGQEYHGSNQSASIRIAGGKSRAETEVARYPVGMPVEVFYNPDNATQSGLNVNTELMLNGRASLVMAAVFLGVAYYAATHG